MAALMIMAFVGMRLVEQRGDTGRQGSPVLMMVIFFAGIFFVMIGFTIVYFSRIKRVGPNEALVITGRIRRRINPFTGEPEIVHFRVVTGGRAFIWPVIERADTLSLELVTVELVAANARTQDSEPVTIDGVAQVKIGSDESAIIAAAERFLSQRQDEIARVARETLLGHLRTIVRTLPAEHVHQDWDALAQQVQEVAADDLGNMGLVIDSLVIQDVRQA